MQTEKNKLTHDWHGKNCLMPSFALRSVVSNIPDSVFLQLMFSFFADHLGFGVLFLFFHKRNCERHDNGFYRVTNAFVDWRTSLL